MNQKTLRTIIIVVVSLAGMVGAGYGLDVDDTLRDVVCGTDQN